MIVVYFACLALGAGAHSVLVETRSGAIRGQDEGGYTTFFGVPFAVVDESNPFGVSLPYPTFLTPFQANDSTIKCPQAVFTATGILQCLRLNIYAPKTTKKNLPVFVWFHGGGFVFGSAGDYDGKYLARQEMIVVTANYRLGPYGFFCLNTKDHPGNQGLKDQVTALKWIKSNIESFGGDPNRVTIAGESYGGGSVELHFYSEFDKLFDKAIIQSGAAEEEAILVNPDGDAAWKLAKILRPNIKKEEALTFLASSDPIAVMKAFNSSDMLLRACKEKRFKNENVENFITTDFNFYAPKKVANTPILVGYNSKETFADFVNAPDELYNKTPDFIYEKIDSNFKLDKTELKKAVDSIKQFYLGKKAITKDAMLELVDFLSDFMINHPSEREVTRFLNQNGVVYKYLFSYIGNSPYKDIKGVGSYHTEELQYLFDWVDSSNLTGTNNLLMRNRMTTMWGNFVKYGNPTPKQTSDLPVTWEPACLGSKWYMDIDLDMKMKKNVYQHRMEFWDRFLEKYGNNSILRG